MLLARFYIRSGPRRGCRRLISQLRNVQATEQFRLVEDHFRNTYAAAFGAPSQASQPSASPTAPLVALKVGIRASLNTNPVSRICVVDTSSGESTIIRTAESAQAGSPQWSPTGQQLAWLSDQQTPGVLDLYVLDTAYLRQHDASPSTTPPLPGTAEAFSWSPDGSCLLVRVAEHGADQAAAYGSDRMGSRGNADEPSWLPDVQTSKQQTGWRSLWIYELGSDRLHRVSKPVLNMWEAVWLGQDRILGVVSDSPTENAWYEASMAVLDVKTGSHRIVYRGKQQLGLPVASPSGSTAAFVDCLSSDRGGVAGEAILLDVEEESSQRLNLNGVDVTWLQWLDEERLCFIGLRGTYTVAGCYHRFSGHVEEHWVSERTCGPLYPEGTVSKDGEFVVVSEGWDQYQQLDIAHRGQSRTILSWANDSSRWLQSQLGPMQNMTWRASDGLEIQGYLTLPTAHHKPPFPLILSSHGGPVWTFRNTWGMSSPLVPLLVSQGYAVLSANPRGSTGHGPAFAEKVLGDMGGMDAQDLLSGVQSMVNHGIADEKRLGIMGVSYGGYMAAWLPALSPIFRAAVPIAPITNWYSYHNTSNIGKYDELFFRQSPHHPDNLYHHRSPVMFVDRNKTPTMQVIGAKDRCVHPSQALEYHRVLSAKGTESALLVYPDEGHGIRQFPAYLDFSARVLDWFNVHLL